MSQFLYQHINAVATEDPDRIALIDGDRSITYQEFRQDILNFCQALKKLNLNAESKLGILCVNQSEFLVGHIAALTLGLPLVPLNAMMTPETLFYIAKDSGINILLVDGVFIRAETKPFLDLFEHKILAGAPPEEIAVPNSQTYSAFLDSGKGLQEPPPRLERRDGVPDVIMYTSGTTARPKGVMLNEDQFETNAEGVLQHLTFTKQDRVIVALPLFHSFGNMMAWVVLKAGGTLILIRQFAPKSILAQIAEHRATILPLAPTIYSFLVELYERGGYDVSSLRYCISGGAALPQVLLKKVEDSLRVAVVEGYGLTETSPVIAVNKFAEGNVPGSVGPILPNVEAKIVGENGDSLPANDIGEICVKGKTVMQGYWQLPQETQAAISPDGWLKTGDLGHLDDQGRLYISAGRIKDLIIRAGENVSPLAIENAVLNHPAVREAAAVGVADERVGERVKLCLSLKPECSATVQELKEFCRKNLAAYMVPDQIEFYEALPKNAAGKIVKSELRDTERA
ncbi:MAG: AMP-binding protein [Candidatus Nitrohelix vancouverensis]|uniref:AMP-binding protein n=1 Tax=Candidatus Nitrohelix vancouverensis TaxID=2705534 RepID=A0A7T0C2J3_9BACT|nr:MAG: AMP-binding protein [Candidatus Nitrohelix vancouverensis]